MLPITLLRGRATVPCFGRFSLRMDFKPDHLAFLLANGYADSPSRASQIWTQSRQYYYRDTGTAVARPAVDSTNLYAASKLQTAGRLPFFCTPSDLARWNTFNPSSAFKIRQNSGSDDLTFPFAYIEEAGLIGIAAIVGSGRFAYAAVQDNS